MHIVFPRLTNFDYIVVRMGVTHKIQFSQPQPLSSKSFLICRINPNKNEALVLETPCYKRFWQQLGE